MNDADYAQASAERENAPETFIPSLTLTDRDDAHAVWLAMMDSKYKYWSKAEQYAREGLHGLHDAAMREAERAERLQDEAHAQMLALPMPDYSATN